MWLCETFFEIGHPMGATRKSSNCHLPVGRFLESRDDENTIDDASRKMIS